MGFPTPTNLDKAKVVAGAAPHNARSAPTTAMDYAPCHTILVELALTKGCVISLDAPHADPPVLDDLSLSDGTSSSGESVERSLTDDDLWGPATFTARGGVEALERNPVVLKMPAHYYSEALLTSLAANSAREASFLWWTSPPCWASWRRGGVRCRACARTKQSSATATRPSACSWPRPAAASTAPQWTK